MYIPYMFQLAGIFIILSSRNDPS